MPSTSGRPFASGVTTRRRVTSWWAMRLARVRRVSSGWAVAGGVAREARGVRSVGSAWIRRPRVTTPVSTRSASSTGYSRWASRPSGSPPSCAVRSRAVISPAGRSARNVTAAGVSSCRTRWVSRGSTEYSRVRCSPRRASFSVRTERLSRVTESRYAVDAVMTMGIRALISWVSSRQKTMPVSGERMTPPSTPARDTSAQKPGPTCGKTSASAAPSAPPTMNIGASTPPDVPEPSDSPQISVLTTRTPTISPTVACPVSSASMTS